MNEWKFNIVYILIEEQTTYFNMWNYVFCGSKRNFTSRSFESDRVSNRIVRKTSMTVS